MLWIVPFSTRLPLCDAVLFTWSSRTKAIVGEAIIKWTQYLGNCRQQQIHGVHTWQAHWELTDIWETSTNRFKFRHTIKGLYCRFVLVHFSLGKSQCYEWLNCQSYGWTEDWLISDPIVHSNPCANETMHCNAEHEVFKEECIGEKYRITIFRGLTFQPI